MNRLLIDCISRLFDQKGFDLIRDVADQMLNRGGAFVRFGSGAEMYERIFQSSKRNRQPEF